MPAAGREGSRGSIGRTTLCMAMGKRKRDRQPTMWVTTTDFPTAASHTFYTQLNQLARERGFDDFAEAQCAGFYADTMGRPGLPREESSSRRSDADLWGDVYAVVRRHPEP